MGFIVSVHMPEKFLDLTFEEVRNELGSDKAFVEWIEDIITKEMIDKIGKDLVGNLVKKINEGESESQLIDFTRETIKSYLVSPD